MANWLSSGGASRRRGRISLLLAGAAACALWAAPSAEAATVTVGSPMTMPANGTSVCGAACTLANTRLGESGADVTSPISGTIVRWRLAGGSTGGPFELRVIRPAGGSLYAGFGTSSPAQPEGSGVQTFLATNLPIQAGDLIGINEPSGSGVPRFTPPTSTESVWNPALPDGTTATAPSSTFPGYESLFNADVESDTDHDGFGDDTQDKCVGTAGSFNGCPSNSFTLGKPKLNKKKGTTTLTVNVPNPGELTGSGNGAKVASAGRAVISKSVGAGPAHLLIKAVGKKKKKLKKKGKVKLNVFVTYTPTGGDPNTQSVKVKLKKKWKKKR